MEKLSINQEDIIGILKAVERIFGKQPTVSSDFTQLSNDINEKTGELISTSTLKRLWGYVSREVTPRLYTLDIFAKYCNYPNWQVFKEMVILHQSDSSGVIDQKRIRIDDLNIGDTLTIHWHPDREIICQFNGKSNFTILKSSNSKLEPGISFNTSDIYFGVPLYMRSLQKEGFEIGDYIAGKNTGISKVSIC